MSSLEESPRYRHEDTEPEDEGFNYSAPDMDYILITSIDTYASSQTAENTRPLRCQCTDAMSMCEQEMVIASNLVPRSPVTHVASAVAHPPSLNTAGQMGNTRRDEASSTQRRDTEEGTVRYDMPPSTQRVSSQVSESLNVATIDACAPERRTADWPRAVRSSYLTKMPQPSFDAIQVADKVIRYARVIRNVREKDVSCLNCGFFPLCPVTGQCGHTRCARCIKEKGKCPCGFDPPESLHVNVLIRDLITKAESKSSTRIVAPVCSDLATGEQTTTLSTISLLHPNNSPERPNESRSGGPMRLKRTLRPHCAAYPSYSRRIPLSPRARYNRALELLRSKQYLEAAPLLALAAASYQRDLRLARVLLAQVITIISEVVDPRLFHRRLNRSVRQLLCTSWIKVADVECILCCEPFTNPVSTPCGHTFCRVCLERTLDYQKRCPLCLKSLASFNLNLTRETVFIQAALARINALHVPPPLEPDFIPIFVCTVAYPSVPCPLFIFDPRYWLMIRRVLDSGSRQFGMVACDRDTRYANFGTILEVRDCVHLEDGRTILSTIGVARFRVIERSVRDGCEVARIRPIIDVDPSHTKNFLKAMAPRVMLRALAWLMRLNVNVQRDIDNTFGKLPQGNFEEGWWKSRDGPAWLWWLVAVLPLRSEIKVLILATDSLFKRLMAVSLTLDTLDRAAFSSAPIANCSE